MYVYCMDVLYVYYVSTCMYVELISVSLLSEQYENHTMLIDSNIYFFVCFLRSHSIFTVYVESHRVVDSGHPPQLRLGKLNFIDLAGTDRLDKQTQPNAARSPEMTETKEINLSLNALG